MKSEMSPENWKNDERQFLIEDQKTFSYADLYNSVSIQFQFFQENFKDSNFLILECNNSFHSYSRFLGALLSGKKVLLCSIARFNDTKYREDLHLEINVDLLELSLNTKAPEKLVLGPLPSFSCESRFIVRTSGSSGKKFKLVLHDPELFFKKYNMIGPHYNKTMAFSPADSIAGIETLFEVLAHKATLVTSLDDLSPSRIGDLIRTHQIDYFQTTPSYMNLMMVSKIVTQDILGSLKKIAFGSEPSLRIVLQAFQEKLPQLIFNHTYGMTEIGIQKTHTDQNDPTRFLPDQNFNPFQIIDETLHIQSMTKMCNYLNETETSSPLGKDWFDTQDEAIIEENYLRVLGRRGDLINVAGRKFFPSELEEILSGLTEILDITVTAEKNDLIGAVVTANIIIAPECDETEFRKKLKLFCEKNVLTYMNPHRIKITKDGALTPRMKKMRKP